MSEKTDEQVGAILESIREVSPKVVEQVVTYWQVVDTVWLVSLGPTVLAMLVVMTWAWRRWKATDFHYDSGYAPVTLVAGIVALFATVLCISVACDLACTVYSPDYYAAECLVRLGN